MNNTFLLIVIIVLLVVIGYLAWVLYGPTAPVVPSPSPTPATTTPSPSPATTTISAPQVSAPRSGATVGKTFTVSGIAPGTWYFEAVFPIVVQDKNGNVIGQGQAQAQSDWMTTAPVPFTASITTSGYSGPATLILKKDNPSGLPQNDASTTIAVVIQ